MLDLYLDARAAGLRPALLDSAGDPSQDQLSLLGIGRAHTLEVRDGHSWLDGVCIGGPLEILRRLEGGLGAGHFPAWIGFFSYEFSRHLGLPTREPVPGLPDAVFHFYPQGYAWRGGALIESPASSSPYASPSSVKVAPSSRNGGRGARGSAPEAPAPASADRIGGASGPRAAIAGLPDIRLETDLPDGGYQDGVRQIRERIRAGEVYQVNLSQRFRFHAAGVDPLRLFERLRAINPSPYMGLMEGEGWALVSGSPERLFDCGAPDASGSRRIRARPIAGTRRRGSDAAEDEALERELRSSPKEKAEHVMLVDLLRNDLARCCEAGSVEVNEAFTVERYSHVMHLVSEVQGRSRRSLAEIVAAIFPGGTITGAPKGSVMQAIAELEPSPRGAYTGSLGYVSGRGADFNILIRSFAFVGDEASFSGGGGIVIDSEAGAEYVEARTKAEALLQALGQGSAGRPPERPRLDSEWRPPRPVGRHPARVLFVENQDSFSFNIVDYLRILGAEVQVVDGGTAPDLQGGLTHLVLGPGPGEPVTARRLLDWTRAGLESGLPLLGICLGHQALGVALGAELRRSPRPIHGEVADVRHEGRGIFEGLPNPAAFARYHSLSLDLLPPALERHAWTDDGVCMAIADNSGRSWGVQFHPESILSPGGLHLLGNFLALDAASHPRRNHGEPIDAPGSPSSAARVEVGAKRGREGARSSPSGHGGDRPVVCRREGWDAGER